MPAKVALHLNASYHPAGVDSGITQTFYTKWYTNYTITGYIASHRAEGMVILKDDAGNWLTFDKTNPDQDDYTGGDVSNSLIIAEKEGRCNCVLL